MSVKGEKQNKLDILTLQLKMEIVWNTYDKELSSEMTAVNENLNIWLTYKETCE